MNKYIRYFVTSTTLGFIGLLLLKLLGVKVEWWAFVGFTIGSLIVTLIKWYGS